MLSRKLTNQQVSIHNIFRMLPKWSWHAFPKALREAMKYKEISFSVLAERTGYSRGHLNKMAKGKYTKAPRPYVIARVASGVRIDPSYFKEYRLHLMYEQLATDQKAHESFFSQVEKPELKRKSS